MRSWITKDPIILQFLALAHYMLFKWMLDSVWKLRYDKKMLKQTCSSGIFMFLIRVTNLIKTAIFFVDKGVGVTECG